MDIVNVILVKRYNFQVKIPPWYLVDYYELHDR